MQKFRQVLRQYFFQHRKLILLRSVAVLAIFMLAVPTFSKIEEIVNIVLDTQQLRDIMEISSSYRAAYSDLDDPDAVGLDVRAKISFIDDDVGSMSQDQARNHPTAWSPDGQEATAAVLQIEFAQPLFAKKSSGFEKIVQLRVLPRHPGTLRKLDDFRLVWIPKRPLEFETRYRFSLVSAIYQGTRIQFPVNVATSIERSTGPFKIVKLQPVYSLNSNPLLYIYLSGPVDIPTFSERVTIEQNGKIIDKGWRAGPRPHILKTELTLGIQKSPINLTLRVNRVVPSRWYKGHVIWPQTRPFALQPPVFIQSEPIVLDSLPTRGSSGYESPRAH